MTPTAGTANATVKTLTDDKTPQPLVSASLSPSCNSLLNTTIPAGQTRVCYYDATLSGSGSVPLVNNVFFTFNAQGRDSAFDSSTVNFPGMSVSKSSATTLVTSAGEVVSYSYLVTNTGTSSLSGISLSDNNVDAAPSCPGTTLAVGASMTCNGQHTVTAAELLAGAVDNTATVSSNEAPNATASLHIPAAAITPGGMFVVGDLTVGPIASSAGTSVTFWGAQWWKLNSLSGGAAPAAFKGFEDTPPSPHAVLAGRPIRGTRLLRPRASARTSPSSSRRRSRSRARRSPPTPSTS